jgi:hypothetical protein
MVLQGGCISSYAPKWLLHQHLEHSSAILSIFSNIREFYVFLGFLKNTWKYLIQRPIFKPLYFYNVFLKILENTSFSAPSKNTRISYVTIMTWNEHTPFECKPRNQNIHLFVMGCLGNKITILWMLVFWTTHMQGKSGMRKRPLVKWRKKHNYSGMNFKPKHNKCHRLGDLCWYI